MLKKRPAGDDPRDPDELVPVLASPLPGGEIDRVLALLAREGVTDANRLTPKIVSANVPRRLLAELKTIAQVEIKRAKDPH